MKIFFTSSSITEIFHESKKVLNTPNELTWGLLLYGVGAVVMIVLLRFYINSEIYKETDFQKIGREELDVVNKVEQMVKRNQEEKRKAYEKEQNTLNQKREEMRVDLAKKHLMYRKYLELQQEKYEQKRLRDQNQRGINVDVDVTRDLDFELELSSLDDNSADFEEEGTCDPDENRQPNRSLNIEFDYETYFSNSKSC